MKTFFVLISALVFSASAFSGEEDNTLLTKDLQNQNLSTGNSQAGQMNVQNGQISAEQLAELQKQMNTLKEKQEEAKKALEELDKE